MNHLQINADKKNHIEMLVLLQGFNIAHTHVNYFSFCNYKQISYLSFKCFEKEY